MDIVLWNRFWNYLLFYDKQTFSGKFCARSLNFSLEVRANVMPSA